ncbi:MAG: protein translocase subunit SecD [bacterium]
MENSLKWRSLVWIILPLLFGILYLTPTFVGEMPEWWTKFHLPTEKLKLGLDLQGGMQLSLGVEVEKAIQNNIDNNINSLKEEFRRADITVDRLESKPGNKIEVSIPEGEKKRGDIEKILEDYLTYNRESTIEKGILRYTLTLKLAEVNNIKESALAQALEIIRNRIDQFGVSEADIQKEGKNRFLIQLPGIKDTQRAIDLIGKTAQLEFKLLDEKKNVNEVLNSELPEGDEILYEKKTDPATREVRKIPYLLKKRAVLTGDRVKDARVGFGEYGGYVVNLRFDKQGAKLFSKITGANIGKPLAIVLDNTVYSAPVIRDQIAGGNAQISGSFTEEEARDLAIALKAGSLPAPVEILEERTVGPTLGKDSIAKGKMATTLGFILVAVFMIIYYNWSGVIADICLFLNLLLIPAILAAFRGTLTLPGIAGIAFTLGMSVDANVLVFERIREELKLGKTALLSIKEGFSLAFWSIFDGNITTFIAGIILYQFGTGPLKGFAVTLMIGLVTSSITAYFTCHIIYDLLIKKKIIKERISV